MKKHRPETSRAPPPPTRHFFRQDHNKLDRLEADSQKKILNDYFPDQSLVETYNDKVNLNEKYKTATSLVLGQSTPGYEKTDCGEKLQSFLKEYIKEKPEIKKLYRVPKGKKGEMSSQYPPIFERARLTKKLYFKTNYNGQYMPQKWYLKPASMHGTVQFKQTYTPALFNY